MTNFVDDASADATEMVPDGGALVAIEQPAVPVVQTPFDVAQLLQSAIDKGTPVDVLERLVGLQERVMDRQAAIDFHSDLAAFQHEVGPIPRNREVTVTPREKPQYNFWFAELNWIAEYIAESMFRHGFSYTWDSETVEGGNRKVACIVRHRGGHSERASFDAPIDNRAQMSDPQKASSAISYARRNALTLALGLTFVGEDDGGRGGGGPISATEAAEIKRMIEESGADVRKFLAYVGAADVDAIPADRYDLARRALDRKMQKGKAPAS